jgi:DNA-binding MarR family transcriptional regulator
MTTTAGAIATAVPLPDVLMFMHTLWAVAHRLETTSKRMGRRLGVTGPQRLALRVVGLYPGLSAGALAAVLHVHPSTLTGVLRRLEAQGLLKRRGDPLDRRRAMLHLTPHGARVNAMRRGTVESAVARVVEEASAGDLRSTSWVLDRIAELLEGRHDDT